MQGYDVTDYFGVNSIMNFARITSTGCADAHQRKYVVLDLVACTLPKNTPYLLMPMPI